MSKNRAKHHYDTWDVVKEESEGNGDEAATDVDEVATSWVETAEEMPDNMVEVGWRAKKTNFGQNKDSLLVWLGCLAGEFLFVLTAFLLLWSDVVASVTDVGEDVP